MSSASIADEVRRIEETVKEELVKASMHLRGQFQEQLNMERQDRHQDNELFALKMSTAETTIAELQKAMAGYAIILENVKLEAARQSAVHADILQQHMEVGIQNDQVQELRQECNSQRLQLVDQSSKFTAIAAENETLRLKLSAVESLLEDVQRAGGARSPQDLSMQSELHSHVAVLKETVVQLCSDVAAQSSINTDHLLHQSGLESLREEVSKLKVCATPAAATMNVSLEQIIQKLRADMEKKFTYLEKQIHIGVASTIAETLSNILADNMHKAERVDKLVEGCQVGNLAGADGNQEMKQSKERDAIFDNFMAVGEWSAGKEAALEEMSKLGSDASSSIHPLPAPEGISTDTETVWSTAADLRKSLVELVDSIQSNFKMKVTAPASVQAQISGGRGSVDTQLRGVSPHFPRRKAESPRRPDDSLLQTWPSCNSPTRTPTSVPPGTSQYTSLGFHDKSAGSAPTRFPNQSLLQTSSTLQSDVSVEPSCSSPTRAPTSVTPRTSPYTSVGRHDNSPASFPTLDLTSAASLAACRPERAVVGAGMRASSRSILVSARAGSTSPQTPLPNTDVGRTNQFAARKVSQSPQRMSRSSAYGGGGWHTFGSEGGGLLNTARPLSPVSPGGLPSSASRNSSNQHSVVRQLQVQRIEI